MQVDIEIDTSQLDREVDRLDARIDNGIRFIAMAHEAEAVKNAKGNSVKSAISVQKKGEARYAVEANATKDGAPIAAFQEFGTGLKSETWDGKPTGTRHWIYPRHAKALKLQDKDGNTIWRRRVAGTEPTHFMRRAWEAIERRVNEIFAKGFNALK